MRIPPFFQLSLPAQPNLLVANAVRHPYHDNSDCPVGQEVQRKGQWQAYEPQRIADTRPRCPLCIELSRPRK